MEAMSSQFNASISAISQNQPRRSESAPCVQQVSRQPQKWLSLDSLMCEEEFLDHAFSCSQQSTSDPTATPSHVLVVCHISHEAQEDELNDIFRAFGDVHGINFSYLREKGMVLVRYYDIRASVSAKDTLRNTLVNGGPIEIHFGKPRRVSLDPWTLSQIHGTIVVSNSPEMTHEKLMWKFSKYGDVKDISQNPERSNQKLVTFYDVRHASSAFNAMSHAERLSLPGSGSGAEHLGLPGSSLSPLLATSGAHMSGSSPSLLHLQHPEGSLLNPRPSGPSLEPIHLNPSSQGFQRLGGNSSNPSSLSLQEQEQEDQFNSSGLNSSGPNSSGPNSSGLVQRNPQDVSALCHLLPLHSYSLSECAAGGGTLLQAQGGATFPVGGDQGIKSSLGHHRSSMPPALFPSQPSYGGVWGGHYPSGSGSRPGSLGAMTSYGGVWGGHDPSASPLRPSFDPSFVNGGGGGGGGHEAFLGGSGLGGGHEAFPGQPSMPPSSMELQLQQMMQLMQGGMPFQEASHMISSLGLSQGTVGMSQPPLELPQHLSLVYGGGASGTPASSHLLDMNHQPPIGAHLGSSSRGNMSHSNAIWGGSIGGLGSSGLGSSGLPSYRPPRPLGLSTEGSRSQSSNNVAVLAALHEMQQQQLNFAASSNLSGVNLSGLSHQQQQQQLLATRQLLSQMNLQGGFIGAGGYPGGPSGDYPQGGGPLNQHQGTMGSAGGMQGNSSRGAMGSAAGGSANSLGGGGGRLSRRNNDPFAEAERKAQQEKLYSLDFDRILSGVDRRTTLMVKNIPNKYTQKMLLATMDEHFQGTYDFFYLPIDFKNKCNVGYAFINMTEPFHIIPLVENFHNKKWERFNSDKVCSISYARIQGRQALVSHFQNSSLLHEDKRCRPILFVLEKSKEGSTVTGQQEAFPPPLANPHGLSPSSSHPNLTGSSSSASLGANHFVSPLI